MSHARRIARLARQLGIPADYAIARHLRAQHEAARLVVIDRAADDGKVIRLAPRAAAAWRKMATAAAAEGIELLPLSGFRSVGRQARIIRTKLAEGQTIGSILRLVAAPGFSEHHTGGQSTSARPDKQRSTHASREPTRLPGCSGPPADSDFT